MKHHSLILLFTLLAFSTVWQAGCSNSQSPMEPPSTAKTEADATIVQLTPEAMRSSQLETLVVETKSSSAPILTTGEIKADENQLFHVSSFVSGRVIQDKAALGDRVRPGQPLAIVQNLEVAKIQANFIHELHQNEIDVRLAKTQLALARKNLEREQRLLNQGISPRKDYLQAQTEATLAQAKLEGAEEHAVHIKAEAKALLSAYGMKPDGVHTEQIRTGSPVVAPKAGFITKKNITVGDMVTPDIVMYEIADLSRAWLDITIYATDLNRIKTGQPIQFTSDSLPGTVFTGVVNYIPPASNSTNPTFIARAYLNNPTGQLRPGMFGQVTLPQQSGQAKPYLPERAIQKAGKETFVFRILGHGRFQKQAITLGEKAQGGYLINQGLQPGEQVIGQGSFTLKAELLKAQFGEEE